MCRNEPFNFQTVLLSYAEEGVTYLPSDFDPYLKHVYYLKYALHRAKRLVKHRLNLRDWSCTDPDKMSFSAVLIKTFSNRTLFDYLKYGTMTDLDYFDIDIFYHSAGFDAVEVITAYHNVKKLKSQIYAVRDKVVANILYCEV